jgi:hypothetical protein
MVARIQKLLCTVLHETHERQVEGTMVAISEGPEASRRATWPVPRGDHRLLQTWPVFLVVVAPEEVLDLEAAMAVAAVSVVVPEESPAVVTAT